MCVELITYVLSIWASLIMWRGNLECRFLLGEGDLDRDLQRPSLSRWRWWGPRWLFPPSSLNDCCKAGDSGSGLIDLSWSGRSWLCGMMVTSSSESSFSLLIPELAVSNFRELLAIFSAIILSSVLLGNKKPYRPHLTVLQVVSL